MSDDLGIILKAQVNAAVSYRRMQAELTPQTVTISPKEATMPILAPALTSYVVGSSRTRLLVKLPSGREVLW